MPPAPPTLPEELLEEIFLRLPPDEPACLARASLASKLWLALLTGPVFRGRYRDFHGAPPMLGFLLSWLRESYQEKNPAPHFVSTAKFGPRAPDWGNMKYNSLDCRHGRVLLADSVVGFEELAVWDPMTGCRRQMEVPDECIIALRAAVLCAVTGCDHRACHEGPFRLFLFGVSSTNHVGSAHAWVFSSESEEWSLPHSPLRIGNALFNATPSVLFENQLYHMIWYPGHVAILKYDMGSNCMSLLDGPPVFSPTESAVLMKLEDGSLGFAHLDCLTLYLWSRLIRSDGVAAWTQRRAVDLKELLAIQNPKKWLRPIGSKEGTDVIFMTTDLHIYEINLNSLEWKKLWKGVELCALLPYMSFYNPPEKTTTPRKAAP